MQTDSKTRIYEKTHQAIAALTDGESDEIAILATSVCELHTRFDYFHWTGFYRTVAPELLKVGPYQGAHGCLVIPFSRGVCGKAAATGETQLIENVRKIPHHIACSATTLSEIVVPLRDKSGEVVAVLDVDSDQEAAFDETDQAGLERICRLIEERAYGRIVRR